MDSRPSEVEVRTRRERVNGARLRILERDPSASLGELLTATLDLAEELTGSQIGFFHFIDDDQANLWLQAWSTNTVAKMCTAEGAGQHYPLSRAGVWADCVRTGQPVVHNDYASLPNRQGLPPGHASVVRELTVPVSRAGRVCAVLGVGNKPSDYDDRDVEDVSTLADLAWDIAARKRAEESLRRSEVLYRTIAHHFPRGVVGLFDHDLRIVLIDGTRPVLTPNPETLVGRRPSEYLPPELAAQLEEAFSKALSGENGHVVLHLLDRTVEVSTHPVRDDQGNVVMGMHMTEDVTEEVALRTRLAVASRLAALGTLVTGVAHEINNPLAAELSDQELAIQAVRQVRGRLLGSAPIDREAEVRLLDDVLEELTEAQECGRRIERIVKDLKLFGRPDAQRTGVRFIDIVEQAMRWMPAAVARTATVVVENGGAPDVKAAAGQIEQVVLNLVTNAAKATPKGKHGQVIVRIGPGQPGMARLDVIDHGTGIEPAKLERIFDPFFTDGVVGKGMGLGLAVSHAIVTSHGGSLTAKSVVGEGSTFRIELPAIVEGR